MGGPLVDQTKRSQRRTESLSIEYTLRDLDQTSHGRQINNYQGAWAQKLGHAMAGHRGPCGV